jgi:hypothetical protein
LQLYLKQLSQGIISEEELKALSGQKDRMMEGVIGYASSFCEKLWAQSPEKLGQLFKQEVSWMGPVYVGYCSRQYEALEVLKLLRKRPSVTALLERIRSTQKACHSLEIEAFLIKPMQRICRYPLLLKELLKYTPPNHGDRLDLESAVSQIEDLIRSINETKRQLEESTLLQSQITGNDDPTVRHSSSLSSPLWPILSHNALFSFQNIQTLLSLLEMSFCSFFFIFIFFFIFFFSLSFLVETVGEVGEAREISGDEFTAEGNQDWRKDEEEIRDALQRSPPNWNQIRRFLFLLLL